MIETIAYTFLGISLLFILWIFYYLHTMPEIPTLYFNKRSPLANQLIDHCPSFKKAYWPLFWCTNAHLNAFLGIFLWHLKVLKFERRIMVRLKDGGQISLDLAGFENKDFLDESPTMLILHGLTGDSHDFTKLAKECVEHGYRAVCMNRRGHGNTPLLNRHLPSTSRTEDIRSAVNEILKLAPRTKIFAIGFSAGASYLAAYMSLEDPTVNRIKGCVYVSPGYSFKEILKPGRIHAAYDRILAYAIKRHMRQHHHLLRDFSADFEGFEEALESSHSWIEMETKIFYKLYKFPTAEEYINLHNNPMQGFERTQVPSLTLSAYDDPICVPSLIPFDAFTGSPAGLLVTTKKGSHTYWLTTSLSEPFSISMWCHTLAFEFFDAIQTVQSSSK